MVGSLQAWYPSLCRPPSSSSIHSSVKQSGLDLGNPAGDETHGWPWPRSWVPHLPLQGRGNTSHDNDWQSPGSWFLISRLLFSQFTVCCQAQARSSFLLYSECWLMHRLHRNLIRVYAERASGALLKFKHTINCDTSGSWLNWRTEKEYYEQYIFIQSTLNEFKMLPSTTPALGRR